MLPSSVLLSTGSSVDLSQTRNRASKSYRFGTAVLQKLWILYLICRLGSLFLSTSMPACFMHA